MSYVANGEEVTRNSLMARDRLIFVLQHLIFVFNFKKSVLHPVKQIDTGKMTFALSA